MGRGADGPGGASSNGASAPVVPVGGPAGSLLAQDRFAPFLVESFDCAGFASAALARSGATAEAQTNELQVGIRSLADQIRDEVNNRYDELLAHSCRLRDSESSLQGVRLSVESLRSAVARVSDEILEPYMAVQSKTRQLSNLQETADLLRHIIHRLKLTGKLRQQLASANSKGSAPLDLGKAAKFITDIRAVGLDADLTGVDVLEADDSFLIGAERQIVSEAEAALVKGMSTLSQAEVGSALQVYYNLNRLQSAVFGLLSQYNVALSKSLSLALDAKKINSAVRSASGAAASTPQPQAGGSAVAVEEMWTRLGRFTEEVHGAAVAVWHLQRVLSKKRDPLSHVCFGDLVMEDGGPVLVARFWSQVIELLKQRLAEVAGISRASTGGRDFVRDALSQGYPRLAALLEGTVAKLIRDTDIKVTEGTVPAASEIERDALLDATGPFLDAYLSAASRRLSDAVTAAFPGGTARPVPTAAEVQKLVGRLHEELKSASASEALSTHLGARVGEALVMLAERGGYMAATGPELRQLGGAANASQLRNIGVCSSLQEVHRAAAGLLPRLITPVADALRAPLEAVRVAAIETVSPMFRAAVEAAEIRILSMHKESFGQESQAYETATSPFVDQLSRLLAHFRSEFLSRFTPQPSVNTPTFAAALAERMACRLLVFFVRHASLLRPLSQAGRLRLTKDMAELEAAVGSSLFPVEQLGTPYRMLRAFKPMLFQDAATLDGSPLLKELPTTIVLHHLYSRAPRALESPLDQGSLTPAQWSLWLDQHSGEEAVARIQAAVNASRSAAAASDTNNVIPLMLKICEGYMIK